MPHSLSDMSKIYMKSESQVSSLEYSQILQKLGVEQEGLFNWYEDGMGGLEVGLDESSVTKGICSAFTVAELGEMLPADVFSGKRKTTETVDPDSRVVDFISCWNNGFGGGEELAETEANARAKMLIYLIENKLV